MRKITEIIVHCTATPAGREVSVAEVDSWHKARGFQMIGYHYLIHLDGSVEPGRAVEMAGAHCLGHNRNSIGVAYVGGVDRQGHPADTRTAAQRSALRRLLGELAVRYSDARIHGHRDFAAKACPSFDATIEYADLCARS